MAEQVRPEVSEVIIKLLAMSVSSEALTGAKDLLLSSRAWLWAAGPVSWVSR